MPPMRTRSPAGGRTASSSRGFRSPPACAGPATWTRRWRARGASFPWCRPSSCGPPWSASAPVSLPFPPFRPPRGSNGGRSNGPARWCGRCAGGMPPWRSCPGPRMRRRWPATGRPRSWSPVPTVCSPSRSRSCSEAPPCGSTPARMESAWNWGGGSRTSSRWRPASPTVSGWGTTPRRPWFPAA